MSEDAYPIYHADGFAAQDQLSVMADTPETAAVIVAAGWASAAVSVGNASSAASARIFAFDWRGAAGGDALQAIPSDSAVLCLVTIDTIDRADALLDGHDARFVFGDMPALIAAELADIKATLSSNRAHDSSSAERARLQALAMELARLADQLGQMSTSESDPAADSVADRAMTYQAETSADRGAVITPDAARVRQLIQMRRLRDRFFDAALFADPAWDMLLDLAASRLEERSVSVSSLCIAAAVPPTTALRWIRMMTEQQLLVRRADPADARRMFIDLADSAFDRVCGWFALVDQRGGPGI